MPNLSHEQLEMLAEDAADFLEDCGIDLISHSYINIIRQAQKYGYEIDGKF